MLISFALVGLSEDCLAGICSCNSCIPAILGQKPKASSAAPTKAKEIWPCEQGSGDSASRVEEEKGHPQINSLIQIETKELAVFVGSSGVESAGPCAHSQAMFIGIALVGLSEDCLAGIAGAFFGLRATLAA